MTLDPWILVGLRNSLGLVGVEAEAGGAGRQQKSHQLEKAGAPLQGRRQQQGSQSAPASRQQQGSRQQRQARRVMFAGRTSHPLG